MNILMATNTFSPHVGGVARSVEAFTVEYRKRGHRVLIVAPEFQNAPDGEEEVIRVPAIQHFNGSDFSVVLPMPSHLTARIEEFRADVVHSHHPFLLGGAALRLARRYDLPLVFTHHTMYEQYTHYVPGNSKPLRRFVTRLSTSYANLCNLVFAPSESTADILRQRGVVRPIEIVPTGVQIDRFALGSGTGFRAAMAIPEDALLLGHVGRLAPEKNLQFLAEAVLAFMRREPRAHLLVVGDGPLRQSLKAFFTREGMDGRAHFAGTLDHPLLASAYRAMDLFAFTSKSETQGIVLTEAMAAGLPVVAIEAPGAREIVVDMKNGRVLRTDRPEDFADALTWLASVPPDALEEMRAHARATAQSFATERMADRALALYEKVRAEMVVHRSEDYDAWTGTLRLIKAQWEMLRGMGRAAESDDRGGQRIES